MTVLSRATRAIQQLFGPAVDWAATECGVIQRRRILTASSLAETFVLGFMQNPRASDDELAQIAAGCGTAVTAQAIDQRHTPRLVAFLKSLFTQATQMVVGADRVLAPILARFAAVTILDSSSLQLPDGQRDQYPGCGGCHGGGQAALKLQTELDLRSGALTQIAIESARQSDRSSHRQRMPGAAGSLQITDLGYFCLAVFANLIRHGVHFLSRLQFGTTVHTAQGRRVDLLRWLSAQPGPFIDQPVRLGKKQLLACRLIAWRVPAAQARRRRQRLRANFKRKTGGVPTTTRLAWCDWTILVTSVAASQLTPKESVVLYRARRQVELLFKRWKSRGLIAELSGSTEVRQMVRIWARLLAALVLHWVVTVSHNGDPNLSLDKAFAAIRRFATRIVAALGHRQQLHIVLTDIAHTLSKTCRRNRRSSAGTNELLNDVTRLDFSLS